MKATKILLTALLLCGASSLSADIDIVLDFGAQYLSTGNVNNITSYSSSTTDLIDYQTGGTLSGSFVSFSGFTSVWYNVNGWTGGTLDWVNADIGNDYFSSATDLGVSTVTVSGLTPGFYKVEVSASLYSGLTTAHEDITIGGSFADSERNGGTSLGDYWSFVPGEGADDYLIWDYIDASSGSITVTITEAVSGVPNSSAISGLHITTAVPEPATYAGMMGGIALLGALIRRRRK